MSALLWAIIIILVLIVLYVIIAYNSLVRIKNRTENAWAQIDVQLKRRYDLIPNLVETVKGYMKHERGTLESLTRARTSLMNPSLAKKAQASNQISEALKTIFAVAENYPKLKASKNFLQLQEELSGTESKIAYARQFYNDSVLTLNQKVQTFPSKVIASIFGFNEKEYFEIEEAAKQPVKVQF
ncbi:LemA family protein [Candidatus Woesearchaeota archaeon]|nr:LemA family protein [Candidatus Woesearchaeota archaeon]